MHKVFISYHHDNDQEYKDKLVNAAQKYNIFIDVSVDTGEISDNLDDESIREQIRDVYLQDSTVTIILVGKETKHRKHVDWEIYSSMYDGKVNKKSGIVVIMLPDTDSTSISAPHAGEKKLYPDITNWTSVSSRVKYEEAYPDMPDRLIDNLVEPDAKISVMPWSGINMADIKQLVEMAYEDRAECKYDLSRQMRRYNS